MNHKSKSIKCPVCGKKDMDIVTTSRKNYTHGKKSTALYTVKKIKYYCKYVRSIKVGSHDNGKPMTKNVPCNFKATIKINHGERDWVAI